MDGEAPIQENALGLPPTQVVAVGYSLVAALSDNAQITFHHAIAEDESEESAGAKVDKLMRIVARQRAKSEAPTLEKELVDLKDKLSQVDEDAASSEANFVKAQADLDVQIDAMQRARQTNTNEAVARHQRSGKGGAFALSGNLKQADARQEAGIAAAVEAKVRNAAERDQFVGNLGANKARMQARIDIVTDRLAAIKELG